MTTQTLQLRERLAELDDLRSAAGLLNWDQQTMMPASGAAARAEVLGTIERISHEKFISAETGRLLDGTAAELGGADPDSDDAALVRLVRRRWEKERRVPTELAVEMARAGSLGQEAWAAARRDKDFSAFAPFLQRNLELAQRYVECFDEFERPYDALLDDYEPDLQTSDVARLFGELSDALVPLIATVRATRRRSLDLVHPGADRRPAPARRQVVALMGFDPSGWRLDEAVHPFATSIGNSDVRITTRWDEGYFPPALYGAMHECGHGLYEAGIAASLQRHPARPWRISWRARVSEPPVGEHGRARQGFLHGAGAPDRGTSVARSRPRRRHTVPGGEPGRPSLDPGRGRRGNLRAAHRAAVRAWSRSSSRAPAGRGPAGGVEHADARVPRALRCRSTPTASCRMCTGRPD